MTELYSSHQEASGTTARELAGVSQVFADYVDEQDAKILHITQELQELKSMLTAMGRFWQLISSSHFFSLCISTGAKAPTSRDNEQPASHHSLQHRTPPTSPTRQALNRLFSRRFNSHHRSYGRHPSMPPESGIRQVYHTQFSDPAPSDLLGGLSRVPSISAASPRHQQGHRRVKKVSKSQLLHMQWQKKAQQQPVVGQASGVTGSRPAGTSSARALAGSHVEAGRVPFVALKRHTPSAAAAAQAKGMSGKDETDT